MSPELARAIEELARAHFTAGSTLKRDYPAASKAIELVVKIAKAGQR